MIDSDVFDFMERCQSYENPKLLLDDLLETANLFGFENLILSGVPIGGQKLAPMVELNGWPAGWFERYVEKDYAQSDGVCLFSGSTHKPFYWHDVPGELSATPESRRVENEATEFGICSGFAVPFLSMNHWQSVVSFASPLSDLRLSDHERAQLVSISTFAGAAIEELVCPESDVRQLTAREKEVLLWLAEGKTAWEVGEILGIAEVTVKKHNAHAREKLGVATTIQAVVKAVRRRLIHP